MKYNPKTHIVGKTYDLTQENMNLMIYDIEKKEVAIVQAIDLLIQIEDRAERIHARASRLISAGLEEINESNLRIFDPRG